MRKELELMEIIENYINGKLSAADKAAFEKKLQADPQLQKEVQLQREVMQGISRAAIRQSAQKGLKKYKFNRNLKNWGLTGLTAAVLVAGSVFLYNSVTKGPENNNAPNELPELNEQGSKLWSDADKYLPLQNFELDTEKDTVVETQDGIVFAIPAHTFLDASGKPATGTVQLEIKEALKAADIMKAGLNTKSGDKLLETGGMFYINARQGDASLKIDPKNAIYAEVPTDEAKPGMQLFEGKRLADGSIDWVNPKPIRKDLIPVDILSLDFYPPHYLDSLKSWGYDTSNKKFTDSLYYSFAAYFSPEYRSKVEGFYIEKMNRLFEQASKGLDYEEGKALSDTSKYDDFFLPHGINPSEIKTIWSKEFQNTLLSTREFEERLPYIFRTCDEHVIDMYINNLDKDLSSIDSMVAQSEGVTTIESEVYYPGDPEFWKFAKRGDGKVKNGEKNVELLKAYYKQKSKMYTEAIAKTVNEFWGKQKGLDKDAEGKRTEQQTKDLQRNADNFQQELNMNLDEAYRQLGKKRPTPLPGAPYGVHIASTGWYNVDAYVIESTQTRTTLDYTDPETGKKAVIRYEPLAVTIENYKDYDRVLVYLLPDELNSFMRVQNKNEVFEEKLNELMRYKLVCIAYKGEKSFYFSKEEVQKGKLSASLIETSNKDIENNVGKLSKRSQSKAMHDELSYIAFEKEDAKRKQQLVKITELTTKIRPVIFPCMAAKADTSATRSLGTK
jgi:hypothetical protein